MQRPPIPLPTRCVEALERLALVMGVFGTLTACLVLLGWRLGIPVLQRIFPGGGFIAPNATLGLLLVSMALIAGRSRPRISQWLGVGALIIGAVSLGEYLASWNAAIDSVLVTATLFLALAWWTAHWLERSEIRWRKAEETARISNARYRRLVESNIIGVSTAQSDGRITEANDECLRIFGYTRTELHEGKVYWDPSISPKNRASPSLGETLVAGRATPREHEIVRRDGSRMPILVGLARLDEEGDPVVAFTLDLTERKRAETERDRFFTLSLDLLCAAGIDGYFRRLNPAFERILGYSEAELLARPFFDFVHPEDRKATQAVVEALAQGEETVGFENRYRCKDGSLRWMQWTAAAAPDGTIFAAARDITERKETEEKLRKMVAELARSNDELQQFAYVASHDLQEPLRAVTGCVQILKQRYQGQLDARADELIGHVVDGATRMKRLIEDLIDYSKVGRREVESDPVDLQACMEDALINLRTLTKEKEAVVTHGELPVVPGNATLLTQLFQNLLGNALKFCRAQPPRIHVATAQQADGWILSISDNGIGIDAQYFERVFGVFQRLHTRREFEGTGIGLAVCRKIMERHGGRIWVESEVGRGSVFRMFLPERAAL
ncbi:MAG: PAS domain S-box protein [Verrucomicrobiota bacterium]